jgi:DNA-binding transcriptional LysR family regulator
MNIDQIDLRKLRAYQLVAQLGNLRSAAARLHQTAPAVSSKIRLLEAELGMQLLDRLPNRLRLSKGGQKFLPEVQAVVERMERALNVLTDSSDLSGRISVSVGSDCSWYIAPRISGFLKRHPDVSSIDRSCGGRKRSMSVPMGAWMSRLAFSPTCRGRLTSECSSRPHYRWSAHPAIPCCGSSRYSLLISRGTSSSSSRVMVPRGCCSTRSWGNTPGARRVLSRPRIARPPTSSRKWMSGWRSLHSLCIAQVRDARTTAIRLEHFFGTVPFRAIFRKERSSSLVDTLIQDLAAPIFK